VVQEAGFRTGKIDILCYYTVNCRQQRYDLFLKSNPDTVFQIMPNITNHRAATWVVDRAPFDDVRVRRAAMMSVDRIGWINSIMGGWGLITGPIQPGAGAFWIAPEEMGDAAKYLEYRPDDAKALMKEAGYEDGVDVTFHQTDTGGTAWIAEGQLMSEFFTSVGIRTAFQLVDRATFNSLFAEGKIQLRYTYAGWGFAPENWVVKPYHSEYVGTHGLRQGIRDSVIDELGDALVREFDLNERIRLTKEASVRIVDQGYVLHGPGELHMSIIQPWIRNVQYHNSFWMGASVAGGFVAPH